VITHAYDALSKHEQSYSAMLNPFEGTFQSPCLTQLNRKACTIYKCKRRTAKPYSASSDGREDKERRLDVLHVN